MSNEELVELIRNGINPSDNMGQLYEQNKGMISKIAKRYSSYADMEDLMQEAYIGLDTAVNHFDISQGVLFLTYAGHWIRASLKRYVDNSGRVIRIPSNELARVSKYQKIINDYIIKYGSRPDDLYLCKALGISYKVLDKLRQTVKSYTSVKSLDEPYGEDENYMFEIIPGSDCVENEAIMSCMKCMPDLWNIIKDYLSDIEYEVIRMKYQERLSLEAMAKRLGVSREKVTKVEYSCMRHLRYRKVIKAISERYDTFQMQYRYTVEPQDVMAHRNKTLKHNAEIRRENCLSNRIKSVI